MAELYRYILVIICLGLLGWGISRVERIYQYPFFMGTLFTSFVLPQAFALSQNPGPVTPEALERVLLMSCLCAAACWIGYERKPNPRWLAKLNIAIDERKLFRAGTLLMIQGLFFSFLVSRTEIPESARTQWTGPATIYLFFSQTVNIALGIFLLQALKHPTIIKIIFTSVAGWPLLSSVLGGRRTPTTTLIIIIGFSLFLVRRITPPRWLVITATSLMIFVIPVLGFLRGDFWNLVFSGNWQELQSASQRAFDYQQSGVTLELRNAALLMDASERLGVYGYGTGWWDSIIFQYVPGQIVGFDFKESLQFNWINPQIFLDQYGYTLPVGSTITGIGDSFIEFGYFGCFVFGLIGYIFKHLWISAVYQRSTFSRFLYMGLVSPAMLGITHGIGGFWSAAIFQVFFSILAAYYSKASFNYSPPSLEAGDTQ
jgi:hypothetical protein